jgi:hypothetical protein
MFLFLQLLRKITKQFFDKLLFFYYVIYIQ